MSRCAALSEVEEWGFPAAAGACRTAGGAVESAAEGEVDRIFAWASVTKVVTALAMWIAVEEGTLTFEDPCGPPGSTLAHLLAHCSGLAPDEDRVLAPPGKRRIYSNRGFEMAAGHLQGVSGLDFATYAEEAVLQPLGMGTTRLSGSPAHGATGSLRDLLALASELLNPTLVARSTWQRATSVAFPGLPGVLPGFGPQSDNQWGLGVEIRDGKDPHWTGRANSPATFGHFGREGSLLWVDPRPGVALASLADRPFGAWAAAAWPQLSDAVVAEWGA